MKESYFDDIFITKRLDTEQREAVGERKINRTCEQDRDCKYSIASLKVVSFGYSPLLSVKVDDQRRIKLKSHGFALSRDCFR